MRLDQSGDPGGYLRSQMALRSRPVANPFHLSASLPLAKDLLHIPKTHAKNRRQLPEATVSPCVRLEYLAPQVILIGSRHACLRRRVSPPIHYTIIAIALDYLPGNFGTQGVSFDPRPPPRVFKGLHGSNVKAIIKP